MSNPSLIVYFALKPPLTIVYKGCPIDMFGDTGGLLSKEFQRYSIVIPMVSAVESHKTRTIIIKIP